MTDHSSIFSFTCLNLVVTTRQCFEAFINITDPSLIASIDFAPVAGLFPSGTTNADVFVNQINGNLI